MVSCYQVINKFVEDPNILKLKAMVTMEMSENDVYYFGNAILEEVKCSKCHYKNKITRKITLEYIYKLFWI